MLNPIVFDGIVIIGVVSFFVLVFTPALECMRSKEDVDYSDSADDGE
jgi:hypothetical protein